MITPELLSYIRGELGKGCTREEIRVDLIKGGGWKEEDLSEAFRIVIPMQGFFTPTSTVQSTIQNANESTVHNVAAPVSVGVAKSSKKFTGILIIIVVVLGIATAFYFYRPQVSNLWGKVVASLPEFSMPSFDFERIKGFFRREKVNDNNEIVLVNENQPTTVVPTIPIILPVRDCGTSVAPDLKNPPTYQNAVLTCLGNSALTCAEAKAVLDDALFPTVFQIVKGNAENQNICSFRLSYAGESTLVDATGKRLAGQYITCPIDVVKMVNESKTPLSFEAPSKNSPGLYAGQIYFYGILGLFMEQDVEKTKILNLGCSGPYIDSVIESYKAQSRQ